MLHLTSWTNFLLGITIMTAGYYILYVAIYYSQNIKDWLSRNSKPQNQFASSTTSKTDATIESKSNMTETLIETSDDSFQKAEELITWLKEALDEAAQKKYSKAELMSSVSAILANYSELKNSAIQSAINELIHSESISHGLVILSEYEMKKLWDEVM